jgi:hypothetical protein
MTHAYEEALAKTQKALDEGIRSLSDTKVLGYTSNLVNAVAGVIVNQAYPPMDISDIAEAYLEAFRDLGVIVGVQGDNERYFYAIYKGRWSGLIDNEAIEFRNALLDAAEEEGWDVEEMG